ncbi:hypothetical protein MSAN_01614100 [Mycena sanguinolenta]|uniref:Uncharacterized protein n=1 Tax=Mycena sanguinolenta TaxID=230812 RepID=A0A8H7CUA7_9AGAR|nr:hypothetical protein MSAN_01614100 [Mycena sanguinolenta]
MLIALLFSRVLTDSNSDVCDDNNNCRELFDIVWGCLITIFAAAWVSVHPNVPPPQDGIFKSTLRRLCMMLIAVIALELIVFFAARQLHAALGFFKHCRVSLTHGFFLSMGGFVSQDGRHPITTMAQLKAEPGYLSSIRDIPRADIMDKSKGDALSKGVALLQGLWFIIQILARFAENLPVTQLEVTTLAFAVVNLFTWVLWWHKPLDVQQPILISSGPPLIPAIQPHGNLVEEMSKTPMLNADAPLSKDDENNLRHSEAGPLLLASLTPEDNFSASTLVAGAPIVLPPTLSCRFPATQQAATPIMSHATHTTVPAFWASPDEPEHTAFAGILVGVVFGAIHCAAWNAVFPSSMERILWRMSAALVAGYPALLIIPHGLGALIWGGHTHDHVPVAVQVLGVALYFILRVIFIVLPFTALRVVDNGWLIDVDWTVYIPHF